MTPDQPVLALPNNARRLTGLPPEYHTSGYCYDLSGETGSDHPTPTLRRDALPLGQQGGVGLCAGVGVPLFTGDRLERPVAVWQRVSLCKGIRPSDTLCLLLMTVWWCQKGKSSNYLSFDFSVSSGGGIITTFGDSMSPNTWSKGDIYQRTGIFTDVLLFGQTVFGLLLLFGWFAERPSTKQLYRRDGSAQAIVSAVTLTKKLQINLSYLSQSWYTDTRPTSLGTEPRVPGA